MPYRIVFTDKSEATINAVRARFDKTAQVMEFLDDNSIVVAYLPLDKVQYIKKIESHDDYRRQLSITGCESSIHPRRDCILLLNCLSS